MKLIFNTYEELSEFCYPFEKNLGSREWSDDEKHQLLDQIAFFYRQRLDEIAVQLGSRYTLMVHVTMDASYYGRCWYKEHIIELNPNLVCYPPILLVETIIHELTHYQYKGHGRRFYTLMERNVHKLELQHLLYGWTDKGILYPTSAIDLAKLVKKKTIDEIRKFFRISYRPSKKRWPSIPNGASLDLQPDWTTFTTPAYINIPRVQGILTRSELVYHAEKSFNHYTRIAAERIGFEFADISVVISNKCGFDLQQRIMYLPVWLIGMNPYMTKRFIVTLLTRVQESEKYFHRRFQTNLELLGLEHAPSPTDYCLLQIFKPWENTLFDEAGKPRIRFEGEENGT